MILNSKEWLLIHIAKLPAKSVLPIYINNFEEEWRRWPNKNLIRNSIKTTSCIHHVCTLGKCILGCMLWDNPLSHRVEREEESKGLWVHHAIIISRRLGCSSCGLYNRQSPKILTKLLIMCWAGLQRFRFNWPGGGGRGAGGGVIQLWDCSSSPGDYNGPACSLHGLRGRQGGRRDQ